MNLKSLRAEVFLGRGEKEGFGRYTKEEVNERINTSYETIFLDNNLRFALKEANIYIPVTQLSVAATAGDGSITVDSTVGFGKNRRICITDGENFEYPTISSISGLAISFSPVLEDDYAVDSYVVLDEIFLPHDCGSLSSARVWDDEKKTLKIHDQVIMDDLYPKRESLSEYPAELYRTGVSTTSDGTAAAVDTTSTTQVSLATPPNTNADYYNGWLLINQTRTDFARISDYVASTPAVFTLETAIAAQVAGDTVDIRPDLNKFVLVPTPETAFYLHITYRAIPPPLVNDWDVPHFIPHGYHLVIVYYTLRYLFLLDTNNPTSVAKAGLFNNFYKGFYNKLAARTNQEEGEVEAFTTKSIE